MNPPTIRHISECSIKPKHSLQESKQPCYLTPWDLALLSFQYIQKGLLFAKPPPAEDYDREEPSAVLLGRLKESLAVTLTHFYPLAGRLVTLKETNPPSSLIFIDCNNSPGARFVHAALDMTIADILSPTAVPSVVHSFFDNDGAVNHDGHTKPLLTVQVTELRDGVFIGCSMNHAVVDGSSFWHFFNTWSEIFKAEGNNISNISRPPIHNRWFPDGNGPVIKLPFSHPNEFICRFEAPKLRERIFHFSSESLAKLKAKANQDCNTDKISSFQALSALVWRSITRVRRLPANQKTTCRLAIDNRSRLDPPLPRNYFGNSVQGVYVSATARELLEHSFGWAAWLLHEAVVNHNNKAVHEWLESWFRSPHIYQLAHIDPQSVMTGSSPRFDMYGNEFGLGKAVAVRSGCACKFDGRVWSYPGREGGGSVDLEVCLSPESMTALESEKEFMDAAVS